MAKKVYLAQAKTWNLNSARYNPDRPDLAFKLFKAGTALLPYARRHNYLRTYFLIRTLIQLFAFSCLFSVTLKGLSREKLGGLIS
jgi:hypothetical protein